MDLLTRKMGFCVAALLTSVLTTAQAIAQTVEVALPEGIPRAAPVAPSTRGAVTQAIDRAAIRNYATELRRSYRDFLRRSAFDPQIANTIAAPNTALALEITEEGGTIGRARLGWGLGDGGSSVDVVLKGPISSKSGVPLTDHGLASGASAAFGYTVNFLKSSVPVARELRTLIRGQAAVELDDFEVLAATILAMRAAGPSRQFADPALLAFSQQIESLPLREADERTARNILRDEAGAALNSRAVNLSADWSLTGGVEIGSKTFKFASLDNLTEREETKQSEAARFGVGYTRVLSENDTTTPLLLFGAGYVTGRNHKGGDGQAVLHSARIGRGRGVQDDHDRRAGGERHRGLRGRCPNLGLCP